MVIEIKTLLELATRKTNVLAEQRARNNAKDVSARHGLGCLEPSMSNVHGYSCRDLPSRDDLKSYILSH